MLRVISTLPCISLLLPVRDVAHSVSWYPGSCRDRTPTWIVTAATNGNLDAFPRTPPRASHTGYEGYSEILLNHHLFFIINDATEIEDSVFSSS